VLESWHLWQCFPPHFSPFYPSTRQNVLFQFFIGGSGISKSSKSSNRVFSRTIPDFGVRFFCRRRVLLGVGLQKSRTPKSAKGGGGGFCEIVYFWRFSTNSGHLKIKTKTHQPNLLKQDLEYWVWSRQTSKIASKKNFTNHINTKEYPRIEIGAKRKISCCLTPKTFPLIHWWGSSSVYWSSKQEPLLSDLEIQILLKILYKNGVLIQNCNFVWCGFYHRCAPSIPFFRCRKGPRWTIKQSVFLGSVPISSDKLIELKMALSNMSVTFIGGSQPCYYIYFHCYQLVIGLVF